MNKVLITNSYFYPLDTKQWKTAQPYPPLGTLYATAWLRKHGFPIAFHDNNLQHDLTAFDRFLEEERSSYLVIYDDGFNYLTKMCLKVMRYAAYEMIRKAKQKGLTVVISSSDSTDHYLHYHEQGADFVIHGEGEITLLSLLKCLEQNRPYGDLDGISYRNEQRIEKTRPRTVLKTLDLLPMPAWDLVKMEQYRAIWLERHGYFALNIASTRGCPFKCNWCAKPIYGNRYNSRSAVKVVEEMSCLTDQYGVDYFWMCDDIFGLKPGWVQEFRDEVVLRKLEIKYKIQSRVDLLLKEDTVEALVESGLDIAWVGAESGSQQILDAMDKGTTIEQIYSATEKLRAHGSKVGFFLQFGYLGEKKSDIRKTLEMLLDLMPDEVGISVSYPLPGTGFYETVKDELITKANWDDSDDLDLMFKNTYPASFYRKLHRYVHYRYRIRKGWMSLRNSLLHPTKFDRNSIRQIISMCYHLPKAFFSAVKLSRYG